MKKPGGAREPENPANRDRPANGRVALVTGTSSGLGKAIAADLARDGYRVYGTSRQVAEPGTSSAGFHLLAMDVDRDASVEAAIASVVRREGRLDVVISNAGMNIAGALEDTSSEEALAQFQTNFFGTHRVCRFSLPHLRLRERAHIVVIGSLGGLFGLPFQGMYCASKFALEGYCEALRMELRGFGVRVAIVEPGDFISGYTAARKIAAAGGERSAFAARFKTALQVMEKDELGGVDPRVISRKVRRIIAADRPALRHQAGAWLQTAAARCKPFLPAGIFEALIARHYKC
jgi:NAD(P)-dependent dehydrogenase (short-subunit alcohol dehydrogenase family)